MSASGEALVLYNELMFDKGWRRTLPGFTNALCTEILFGGAPTRRELSARLQLHPHLSPGLGSSAWEPLHPWTDKEIAELDEEFGPVAEPRTATELQAAEAAQRESDLATLDRYFASKGLPSIHSLGGLLDLLVACGVIVLAEDERYFLNPLAPLPGEVLPLDAQESGIQDSLRWDGIHERSAQAIIRLFRPDGEELDHLLADLTQYAEHLDSDPEDARSALEALLQSGDFTASLDVARVGVDQPFTLRVDWEAFHKSRLSIRFGQPDEE